MFLSDETGFSLVELIVSMVIMTALVLGFFIFGHNLGDISRAGTARVQLQQEGSLIMEDVVKDIREADTITVGDAEGGVNNYLVIESPTITTMSYWSVEGVPDAGHQEGELYKQVGTDTPQLLLGDYNEGGVTVTVNDLIFSDNLVSNLVSIDLDMQLIKTNLDSTTITMEVVPFDASAEPRNR